MRGLPELVVAHGREIAAMSLETAGDAPAPYHGYFFRILTRQGQRAPGGAEDYVKDG